MLEFITITGAILGWLSSAFIVYDRVLRSRLPFYHLRRGTSPIEAHRT